MADSQNCQEEHCQEFSCYINWNFVPQIARKGSLVCWLLSIQKSRILMLSGYNSCWFVIFSCRLYSTQEHRVNFNRWRLFVTMRMEEKRKRFYLQECHVNVSETDMIYWSSKPSRTRRKEKLLPWPWQNDSKAQAAKGEFHQRYRETMIDEKSGSWEIYESDSYVGFLVQ